MATISGTVRSVQPDEFVLSNTLFTYIIQYDGRTRMDDIQPGEKAQMSANDPGLKLKQVQTLCRNLIRKDRVILIKLGI